MADVVMFHVESSLRTLREHISRELLSRRGSSHERLGATCRAAAATIAEGAPPFAGAPPAPAIAAGGLAAGGGGGGGGGGGPTGEVDDSPMSILEQLEQSCAAAFTSMSHEACTSMLASARRLLDASRANGGDKAVASFAQQLIAMLAQLAPFLDGAPGGGGGGSGGGGVSGGSGGAAGRWTRRR